MKRTDSECPQKWELVTRRLITGCWQVGSRPGWVIRSCTWNVTQPQLYCYYVKWYNLACLFQRSHSVEIFKNLQTQKPCSSPLSMPNRLYVLLRKTDHHYNTWIGLPTYFLTLPVFKLCQLVKNPPAKQEMQETCVWSLGWEDPLEEGMATHSSTLAWRIPWTEEPGGLQSRGSQRVRYD